jgi:hypothetical protein
MYRGCSFPLVIVMKGEMTLKEKAGISTINLDSVINIKYVLLFSRRDGRGLPEGFISDTALK